MFTIYRGNVETQVFICVSDRCQGDVCLPEFCVSHSRRIQPSAPVWQDLLGERNGILKSICSKHNCILNHSSPPHPVSTYYPSFDQMLFTSALALTLERHSTPLFKSQMAESSSGKSFPFCHRGSDSKVFFRNIVCFYVNCNHRTINMLRELEQNLLVQCKRISKAMLSEKSIAEDV